MLRVAMLKNLITYFLGHFVIIFLYFGATTLSIMSLGTMALSIIILNVMFRV
jgi:hypothetical protein